MSGAKTHHLFAMIFILTFLFLSYSRCAEPAWKDEPIVEIKHGLISGKKDRDHTWVWKGIPYAAPPVKELRWRAPIEPESWERILKTKNFGSPSLQFSPFGGKTGKENCLYLNVWRPRGKKTDLPVYVWIHGGGNTLGSANQVRDYYGNRIAANGSAVFVSVNYRLGPFGWFSAPQLREGRSALDDSGNYGTLDLIYSLKWIQTNIRAFGGDPDNVTIAGESAGGMNVLSLLISPETEGLFHKAVIQSGVAVTSKLSNAERAAKNTILELIEHSRRMTKRSDPEEKYNSMTDQEMRDWLRSVKGRKILSSMEKRVFGMSDVPSIIRDGEVIPESGYEVFSTGNYPNKLPIIIGSNKEEIKLFYFLGAGPKRRGKAYAPGAKYGSMKWKADSVDTVAEKLSTHKEHPPVYAYLYSWGAPDEQGISVLPRKWGYLLGAGHAMEISAFTGQDTILGALQIILVKRKNRTGRQELATAMHSYLINFIQTGDPNSIDLPKWQAWQNGPGNPKTLIFDAGPDQAEIHMMNEQVTHQSILEEMQKELSGELLEWVKKEAFWIKADWAE